jgi:hypothetical protein
MDEYVGALLRSQILNLHNDRLTPCYCCLFASLVYTELGWVLGYVMCCLVILAKFNISDHNKAPIYPFINFHIYHRLYMQPHKHTAFARYCNFTQTILYHSAMTQTIF